MSNAKDTILQAASELFLEGGASALNVRGISKRAGVSTIGIYSHFKGKQGILDKLYIEGFEKILSAMDIPDASGPVREVILQGVKGYLDVGDQYEAHYRLIFGEGDTSYSPSEEAQNMAKKAFEKLVDISSIMLPEDTEIKEKQRIALEIWAFVHGYVSLKHHFMSTLVFPVGWNTLALSALATHIDAIIAKHAVPIPK
jgi:AcrR family transcriptional regulator